MSCPDEVEFEDNYAVDRQLGNGLQPKLRLTISENAQFRSGSKTLLALRIRLPAAKLPQTVCYLSHCVYLGILLRLASQITCHFEMPRVEGVHADKI